MATGDYCTLDELKARLWPSDQVPDDVNDTELARIIAKVSREINLYTGTRFYNTGSDETRYFTAQDVSHCWIDLITTITSVATDDEVDRTYSTSWTEGTHFEAYPYNASSEGLPYFRIDRLPLGSLCFPTSAKAVKVVGRFNYHAATAPASTLNAIKEACLLQCLHDYNASPTGVLGPTEVGQIAVVPGWHPDAKRTLDAFKISMV